MINQTYKIRTEYNKTYVLDVYSNIHMRTNGILTLKNKVTGKIYYWDTINMLLNNDKIVDIK